MNQSDLTDLLERSSRGDGEAFGEVVRRFHPLLYRWAVALSAAPDDADDLAQDVWIRVYPRVLEWRGEGEFSSWLYRIAYTLAGQRYRRAQRRIRLLASYPADPQAGVVYHQDRIDQERLVEIIRGYLEGLPLRQRAVISMADLEDLSSPEIAERLGIAESTVRVTLSKARKAIRKRLLAEHPRLVEEYQE